MTPAQLKSAAAFAFAGFAAWYALKGSKTMATGSSAADTVFGNAKAQRQQVGAALQNNLAFANDFTSQYAKRQGVPSASVDVLGHTADYYSFQPSYALG
jgi:hypothetical protein